MSLLRNIYRLVIIFFLVYLIAYSLIFFNLNDPFSLLVMFSVVLMIIGQMLLITPFGFSYPLYLFSFEEAIFISMLIWLSSRMPFYELGVLIYIGVVAVLIALPLIIHWLTKKRIGTIQIIPTFSIFFFGLVMALSNVKNLLSTSLDWLFLLAVTLFILTSILGSNMAYRTMMLNRELKIGDRNQYLRKTRDDLLKKCTHVDAHADVDLLTYYLSSSLDSFVDGDLERSFMDAFKIIDNEGKAFKTIYTLRLNSEQWKKLKSIRNNLSHAHISEDKEDETEKKKDLEKLKELKKGLFRETLNILSIVRFQFIDNALKSK